jgi:flagellar hook-basal body complex protein FliE
MAITGIDEMLRQIPAVKGIAEGTVKSGTAGGTASSSFGDMLSNALKEVNDLQNVADNQIEGLTLKEDGVTPHSAMLALEKADIAFQLMSSIRSKIIRAYEEVIRTQV